MRLAKYLAHCGVASRRRAEQLIAAGRVGVAGKAVTDPARDVDEGSGVEVDGRPVSPEPREVWVLNKPAGVVSTAREPGRRPAVVELVASSRRLYPVGRLDVDSTGLILLTNDGELANRLGHPRYGIERSYRVRLRRPASQSQVRRLRAGVELEDGPTAPARLRSISPRVIELTLTEGRNRQVRRMGEAVGHPVQRLHRSRYAGIGLGRLEPGRWRPLSRAEWSRLGAAVGLER
jgi:23S rRNA pseudouridine2605 synthase